MMPGSTSHPPPEFPGDWCGLWKDEAGRVFHIRPIRGRIFRVDYVPGVIAPWLPFAWGGDSQGMSGLFAHDYEHGLHLRVETGPQGEAPCLVLMFFCHAGERARFADGGDAVHAVQMQVRVEQPAGGWAWAEPMGRFRKSDEDLRAFMDTHT